MNRFPALLALFASLLILVLVAPTPATATEGELVSLTSAGVPANGDSQAVAMSSNGRFVLFTSNADNLPGPDIEDPDYWLMYRRDLVTGRTILVSIGPDGRPMPVYWDASQGDMSADGSVVAFVSYFTDSHVYVRNLVSRTTTLESKRTDGVPLQSAGFPQLSRNARRMAFMANGNAYGRDLVSGRTRVLLRDEDGRPTPTLGAGAPTISGNGRYIAFEPYEVDGEPPGCGTGEPHIYDWRTGIVRCIGTWGADYGEAVELSYTGRYLAWHEFDLRVSDLVTGETVEVPLYSDEDPASWSDDERYLAFGSWDGVLGNVVYRLDRITGAIDMVTSLDGYCIPAGRALTATGAQVLVTCFDDADPFGQSAYLFTMAD